MGLARMARTAHAGYCKNNDGLGELYHGVKVESQLTIVPKQIYTWFSTEHELTVTQWEQHISQMVNFPAAPAAVDKMFLAPVLEMEKNLMQNIKNLLKVDPKPPEKLHFTGFGIGGASAVIAAYIVQENFLAIPEYSSLRMVVITFGQPRIGNVHFARLINRSKINIYRVTHTQDPIIRFPTYKFGFRHHEMEYWIGPKTCDCEGTPIKPKFDMGPTGLSEYDLFRCRVWNERKGQVEPIDHPECSAGQPFDEKDSQNAHWGPYFNVNFQDCSLDYDNRFFKHLDNRLNILKKNFITKKIHFSKNSFNISKKLKRWKIATFIKDNNDESEYKILERLNSNRLSRFEKYARITNEVYCRKDETTKIGQGIDDINHELFRMRENILSPYEAIGYDSYQEELVDNDFYSRFKRIRDLLDQLVEVHRKEFLTYQLKFTGHGEGGVWAVLSALAIKAKHNHIEIEVYTFGAPRMGNYIFARKVNRELTVHRITYFNDQAPQFPPQILTNGENSYWHHLQEFWILPIQECNCLTPEMVNQPLVTTYRVYRCLERNDENGEVYNEPEECNKMAQKYPKGASAAHFGPYFGVIMNDCSHIPTITPEI
ncbi:hypothetical protein G9A89_004930 [Geosiphon pyriformis]|nr:hypothetical protein G9A89_004930 [Geosiphon pyriformis]